MTRWYSPSVYLPDQGKKVLCMKDCCFYVAQRFADIWCQIPFTDSEFAFFDPPELWQEIDYPNGITGYLLVGLKRSKKLYTIDELEKKFPESYDDFIKGIKQMMKAHAKK